MDAALKELTKLEKLTNIAPSSGRGASTNSTQASLDALLRSLHAARDAIATANDCSEIGVRALAQTVETRKKEVDDRQKEVYSVLARLGKAMDKKFPTQLPSYPDLFSSPSATAALERTIALHLLRTGQFDVASTFINESDVEITDDLKSQFVALHHILKALRDRDIGPALQWAREHESFLRQRSSPLEFYLHRSQYIRLLLSSHPPNALPAIAYARTHMQPFYATHRAEFVRLLACPAYLPLHTLQKSVYADLASPTLHFDLEPLFAKEYCASLGLSRQVPLRVVGDIGGGGALARIEKGRKVLGDRKGDWNRLEELPIEIPLPPDNRYHSIFTCLVSKEQSTESNPPMMMTCGHVISKDALQKLNRTSGRCKCPYCPIETQPGNAIRLQF